MMIRVLLNSEPVTTAIQTTTNRKGEGGARSKSDNLEKNVTLIDVLKRRVKGCRPILMNIYHSRYPEDNISLASNGEKEGEK